MNQYEMQLSSAIEQMAGQFREQLNYLAASSRAKDRQLEDMSRRVDELRTVLGALNTKRSGDQHPGLMRIEDIPGRRVPYTLLIDIPIGANTTSRRSGSVAISQEGPFVAVKRMATFQSAFEAQVTNPESGDIARFAGRSFGRYRPIHSAWDVSDAQHNATTDAGNWFYQQLLNFATPAGTPLPTGALGLPSNMSSFRTMEFDGRITVINAGSSYPRQNISVPSSMWTPQINSPQMLGCLDVFERGEILTVEVQPNHVNNPPAGNVDGSVVLPAVVGLGVAAGWPFVAGQYDAHEGIATAGGASVGSDDDPRLPRLLDTDSVQRLPDGILTIGWEGYRIIQPISPVG